MGTIRRLGAEVLEYPVGERDAIVGRLVNQLELPREALVSVIVRDDEALLPRGSTEIEAGDRLHILVRGQVRDGRRGAVRALARRARSASPSPGARRPLGPLADLQRAPWREEMGDPARPERIEGVEVLRRCARGASSPARWCCSTTAASP